MRLESKKTIGLKLHLGQAGASKTSVVAVIFKGDLVNCSIAD